jgi:TonB family protein
MPRDERDTVLNKDTPRCDRFEREALLSLERGEPLGAHFTSCPDCGRSYRKYRFLLAALPDAHQAVGPRPGWQAGVLAALGPGSEPEHRWQAPGVGRAGMFAAFAGATLLAVIAARVSTSPAVDVQPVVETTEKASEADQEIELPAQKPPAKPPSAQKPSAPQRPVAEAAQPPAQETEPAAPQQAPAAEDDSPVADEPAAPDPSPPSSGTLVHPRNLDSCIVTYTPEAYAAQVQGRVVVRCTIKANGQNTDCRVLRGLPHMNKAIVEAMNQCRTEPVTLDGKPVDNSEHTWYIRLSPPPPLPPEPPELRTPPSPILQNPLHYRYRFSR